MFQAFIKALSQLNDPAIRRPLWLGGALAGLVFMVLWALAGWLLTATTLFAWGWLEVAADLLGGTAVAMLTWFLFPGVVSGFAAFFLDGVARAVEARHYPGLPPAPGMRATDAIISGLRFLGISVLLNLGLLLFLLVPPVFPFVFYSANGYLLGREYFELVAARRLGPAQARRVRKAHRGRLFFAGVGVTFLLTLPVLNLVAPVVATAAMVHLLQSWSGDVAG
ncbi:MAG TPA: hypothetical protein ENI55_01635 [Alphaproteobacteria bacterium]|nr:hypothetical protein [Alphaproteobacteria bacterium]